MTGQLIDAVMARAYLIPDTGPPLHCAFNPSQLSISQSAQWQASTVPRRSTAAPPQFVVSQPRTLSLELFFDRSVLRLAQAVSSERSGLDPANPSVEPDVDRLLDMTRPKPNVQPPEPPLVTFGWGLMQSIDGYVKNVSVTYLLFSRTGYPYRAKARLEFVEHQAEPRGQNPTSGAERARKSHRLGPGDTLQSVAFANYGDPQLWRGLAAVNSIDDPLRLKIGDEILLPEEEELVELS